MEPSTKRAPADPSFVAETRFTGAIVTCLWPREAVARLLPPALCLDAAHTRRGRHPVVFIFGEHDRSTVFYATLALPTGVRFLEFMAAVPYVRAKSSGGPGMFVPFVFSGDPIATWSGNAHYGFVKRMVPMEWLGNMFVVTDERDNLLAHCTAEPSGPWRRSTAPPARPLSAILALGRLPAFGHRPDGQLVESRFDWGIDTAWIRRIRTMATIDASLGPGMGPRVGHARPAAGVEVSGMRWRLSWPEPCGR